MLLETSGHDFPRRDALSQPCRIQRRLSTKWEVPHHTVCVDSSTPWGNPFIVGLHGTRSGCVRLYAALLAGNIVYSIDNFEEQIATLEYVERHIDTLIGKNLACWCDDNGPCHADVLLELANSTNRRVQDKPIYYSPDLTVVIQANN